MKKLIRLLAVAMLLLPTAHAAEGGLKLLSFSTLIGQMITFAILIWVMMKYVWPPLMNAIESRQKEIADGLAAAEQGRQDLASAGEKKESLLKEARAKTGEIIADGEQRRSSLIEKAKQEAETERTRIIELGKREVEAERISMQREMQEKLGELVVSGASQILRREVDGKAHQDIVDSLKKAF